MLPRASAMHRSRTLCRRVVALGVTTKLVIQNAKGRLRCAAVAIRLFARGGQFCAIASAVALAEGPTRARVADAGPVQSP